MKGSFAEILAEVNKFIIGMTVLGMNGFVWFLVLTGRATTSVELTMAIVTTAGTFTGLVIGYHFGSSASSAAKDRANAAPPPPPKAP